MGDKMAIFFSGLMMTEKYFGSFHWVLIPFVCTFLLINYEVNAETKKYDRPPNFPKSMKLEITTFVNWADDLLIENVWTAYPKSAHDIVDAANWAMKYDYKIRPSGHMHTWSPLTIGRRDVNSISNYVKGNDPPKIILLKTSEHLNKMKVIQENSGIVRSGGGTGLNNWNRERSGASFWAETGISLFNLTRILENNDLSFLSHPATGTITLGGILAIGGHGAGVPAVGEKKVEGMTYGTMSNLIISLTAVVYDAQMKAYKLKSFHRSEPETKSFLVSLGRIFITNVTMRVGPLQYLQCESRVDVRDTDLFAHPSSSSRLKFSKFLDEAGRVESILFPFTNRPWLKIWKVFNKNEAGGVLTGQVQPTGQPYNYPFSENMPKDIALIINDITVSNNTPKAVVLGNAIYKWVASNLQNPRMRNFWGASRNSLLYVKASTLRMTANGYAILTSRPQVQRVLHETYNAYNELLHSYRDQSKFPINGPLEIRVSGIDDPRDVGIEGAESPALSAILPNHLRKDFDTVVWVDVLTFARTPGVNEFMRDLENFLTKTFHAKSTLGRLRVEWSKGWGYTLNRPWSNEEFLKEVVPSTFPHWTFALNTFKRYDPHEIFTDSFLRLLLK